MREGRSCKWRPGGSRKNRPRSRLIVARDLDPRAACMSAKIAIFTPLRSCTGSETVEDFNASRCHGRRQGAAVGKSLLIRSRKTFPHSSSTSIFPSSLHWDMDIPSPQNSRYPVHLPQIQSHCYWRESMMVVGVGVSPRHSPSPAAN